MNKEGKYSSDYSSSTREFSITSKLKFPAYQEGENWDNLDKSNSSIIDAHQLTEIR